MRKGGSQPTVFNAANERAVAMFLDRRISYPQITEIIEDCMEHVAYISDPTLDQVLETEQAVYEYIGQKWATWQIRTITKTWCMSRIKNG